MNQNPLPFCPEERIEVLYPENKKEKPSDTLVLPAQDCKKITEKKFKGGLHRDY